MTQSIQLKFASNRYGRKSQTVITVAYDDWNPRVAGWVWPAMKQYEKETSLSPAHLTEWDSLRHALPSLSHVFCWEGFTAIPTQELEIEDVRDLFMDIDDTFHRLWGADRGALRSSRVRRFLLDYLLSLRPDGKLSRVKVSFAPKGRANHTPRGLISDQVSYKRGTAVQAPVGALPHANPDQLKALTKKRLEADLQRISDACCKEVDAYFKACAVLHRIRTAQVDVVSEKRALEKIHAHRGRRMGKVSQLLTTKERAALTAYYLRLDNTPTATFVSPRYLGTTGLVKPLSQEMGIEPDNFLRCARYQYYPHQIVLVAAIILIQISTSWNVGPVMELTTNGIRVLDGDSQYLLQSVKTKTRDDTPSVFVEGDDDPGVKALRFALGRLKALKDRGWADANEVSLWLGPRSNYDSSRGLQISNLSHSLAKLREKYDLPAFTFEQIRVQKLTVISLDKGPIAAAEVAGHSTFGTIGGYIDHLLTTRVNSSVNLEFQRRWEAEVVARITRKPQKRPLMPIGDGASCLEPRVPPDEAWLQAGVCDGSHCHAGEGCPNRVLVIDSSRVQEVVLTRRYYDANWQRLYAGNPQAFAAIHMPRMEFNTYLYEFLRKGPYRHMLNG